MRTKEEIQAKLEFIQARQDEAITALVTNQDGKTKSINTAIDMFSGMVEALEWVLEGE